jgi:hypothetical protein
MVWWSRTLENVYVPSERVGLPSINTSRIE